MKDPRRNETLCIRLLDADTGRELAVMLSAGVHSLTHRYGRFGLFRPQSATRTGRSEHPDFLCMDRACGGFV